MLAWNGHFGSPSWVRHSCRYCAESLGSAFPHECWTDSGVYAGLGWKLLRNVKFHRLAARIATNLRRPFEQVAGH
eukprot:1949698-Amphidinium_carterae.1